MNNDVALAAALTHLEAAISYLAVARSQLVALQEILDDVLQGIRAREEDARDDVARDHEPHS